MYHVTHVNTDRGPNGFYENSPLMLSIFRLAEPWDVGQKDSIQEITDENKTQT